MKTAKALVEFIEADKTQQALMESAPWRRRFMGRRGCRPRRRRKKY